MSGSKVPHGPPPLLGGAGKHLGHDGSVSQRARQNLDRMRKGEDIPPALRESKPPAPTPYPENKRKKQIEEQEEAAESPDTKRREGPNDDETLGHDGKREPHRPPPKGMKKKKAAPSRPAGPGPMPPGPMPMPPPPMPGQMGPGAPMGYDSPDKMKMTMDEFKGGELHSGSKTGPKVTNRKQAIAIGLSQARKAGQKT